VIPDSKRILSGYTVKQFLVRLAEEYLWWIIRSLPGYEGVWLRYLFLKCTTKRLAGFCWISQGCTISNSHGLSIGKNFATNRNVLIDAIGGIEIGDSSGIGPNCVLLSHEHSMLTKESYTHKQTYRRKPISIGSGVWISSNCFIKAGVTIGDNAVVGACSSVIADVPSNGRVIGSPARPYSDALREFLARTDGESSTDQPRHSAR
jgi:acetyltransferase-like isoleucine patch superfamily enzyme